MEGDLRMRVIEGIKYLGMSQNTLAKETGISLTTLALWMAGKLRGNNSRLEIRDGKVAQQATNPSVPGELPD